MELAAGAGDWIEELLREESGSPPEAGVRAGSEDGGDDGRGREETAPAGSTPSPLKFFGGKHYLARPIIDIIPRHLHYCEPFFGSGAVLLARDPDDPRLWLSADRAETRGVSEVVNDINGRLVNFWRALQGETSFAAFVRRVEAIPLARAEWDRAHAHRHGDDPIGDAVAFFVDCRQSRAGMMKDFTSITRKRTRRQMNGNVSEWLGAVDGLPDVHARLRRVLIENRDGIELIRREDTPNTLFYVDAPYVHGTRRTTDGYEFEMTDEQHIGLVETLSRIEGKAIVSMYRHPIYDVLHERHRWYLAEIEVPIHAAGGENKRRMTECLWTNYVPSSVAR
jgi:DNA adenine methylase